MSDTEDTTGSLDRREVLAATGQKVGAVLLLLLSGKGTVGRTYPLLSGTLVVGRSSDADIWVDDEGVSRHHAKLVCGDGKVELIDLSSRNGTFCNGAQIQSQVLQSGDKIQIGNETIFKFTVQDELDEAMQKNLYESATKDGLTGVHNKKFFLETLEKEFAFCSRHGMPLSLVMIDIDHFKKVNDTHGHPAGDQALVRLAAAVTGAIRTEDLFARYGGEEFVLMLRECPRDRAMTVAERLRRTIEKLDFSFNNQGIPITISLGVVTFGKHDHPNASALIEAADKALYRAKGAGRNRVEAA